MEVAKAQLPQKRRQELLRLYKREALQAQRRSHKSGMHKLGCGNAQHDVNVSS